MSEKTRSQWFDEYILSIPRPRDATHDGFVEYLIEKLNSQLTPVAGDGGWWCACGWANHNDEPVCTRPSCKRPRA